MSWKSEPVRLKLQLNCKGYTDWLWETSTELTVLQIRRGNRDYLGIISHVSPEKHILWPIIRTVSRDGSNGGSQHMFSLRNKKNYLWIILNTPFYLKLWIKQNGYTLQEKQLCHFMLALCPTHPFSTEINSWQEKLAAKGANSSLKPFLEGICHPGKQTG